MESPETATQSLRFEGAHCDHRLVHSSGEGEQVFVLDEGERAGGYAGGVGRWRAEAYDQSPAIALRLLDHI